MVGVNGEGAIAISHTLLPLDIRASWTLTIFFQRSEDEFLSIERFDLKTFTLGSFAATVAERKYLGKEGLGV